MGYSTNTSIYTILPGLTNNSTTTDIINQHIARIAGKIDSYVIGRYNTVGWTSASSTPQIIQQISDALVTKWTMKSLFTRDGQNRNEWVEEFAKEAKEDLEKISKGELAVTLNGAEESESASSQIDSTRKDYTPIFDVDSDLDHAIDNDLLDDIGDDRS